MRSLLSSLASQVRSALTAFKGEAGEEVGLGANGTPTSRIDTVAEEAVLSYLERENVRLNVMSEERGLVDNGAEETLVLDPIDGTHNAVRGLPLYAVSIAAGKDSLKSVWAGLVMELNSGRTYYAEAGKGAWCDQMRIHAKKIDFEDTVFSVYLGERAHPKSYQLARRARRVRSLGAASLDMCMVAQGAFDLYYLNSTATDHELRVMDIAASTLILREAGGEVYNLERKVLDMPFDPRARTNLIAVGDLKLLEVVS